MVQVVHYSTITIPRGDKRMKRALRSFYEALATPCDFAVIEGPAYYPDKVTEYMLNQLHGIFKAACDLRSIPYPDHYEAPAPSHIKAELTGSGRASKADVSEILRTAFDIGFADDEGYDLSDAAACAVMGVRDVR
jgi:Holliday junction resolvasome RuvABC endonuclease subunit